MTGLSSVLCVVKRAGLDKFNFHPAFPMVSEFYVADTAQSHSLCVENREHFVSE